MRSPTIPVLFAAPLVAFAAAAENWPQFRGPTGDGVSTETGLPVQWDSTRNIVWKAALPGPGHSSPIIWGDRIFLTAFAPDRSSLGFLIGRRGRLLVLCLDRDAGQIVWQREVESNSIESVGNGNLPATPTPATDGHSVFVYFGSHGIAAFDWNGRRLWDKKIGPFPNHMGSASSLVLSGDTLLLNCETDGPDFLLALDKNTGATRWKTPRKQRQAGYSTPVVSGGAIFVSGHETVKAYDAATGRQLWAIGGMTTYVVPTPVVAHGLLFATSSGPGGSALLALRRDGTEAWRADRAAAYIASPVVVGDWLFAVKDHGVERCWASPAISNRRIFLRSDSSLFSIGAR